MILPVLAIFLVFRGSCGHNCFFPSTGLEDTINECRYSPDYKKWWCPETKDFYSHMSKVECPGTDLTIGGNDPGRECRFPSIVRGENQHFCMPVSESPFPVDAEGLSGWCPTTSDFDYDKKWTFCRSVVAESTFSLRSVYLFLILGAAILVLLLIILIVCVVRVCGHSNDAADAESGETKDPNQAAALKLDSDSLTKPPTVEEAPLKQPPETSTPSRNFHDTANSDHYDEEDT